MAAVATPSKIFVLIPPKDIHRQRFNWIDATGQLSPAFDFTTKGIFQEAVEEQFWRLRDHAPMLQLGLCVHSNTSRIPTVFYDSIHGQIVKLIDIPKRQDIHNRSSIRILEAQPNLYSAITGEKLCMKIGDGSWCPAGRVRTQPSGHRYAVWKK